MRLTLIQLSPFAAKWSKLNLSDEDLQSLEGMLIADPESGDLIPPLREERAERPDRRREKGLPPGARTPTPHVRNANGAVTMPKRATIRTRKPRVADEIMTGIRELQRMMDHGKTPQELFTVKTIEVPDPSPYRPNQIRDLRNALGVSQAVFSHLLGVSLILVKSWERGTREPSLMARRLLDTIKADPARWLTTMRKMAAA